MSCFFNRAFVEPDMVRLQLCILTNLHGLFLFILIIKIIKRDIRLIVRANKDTHYDTLQTQDVVEPNVTSNGKILYSLSTMKTMESYSELLIRMTKVSSWPSFIYCLMTICPPGVVWATSSSCVASPTAWTLLGTSRGMFCCASMGPSCRWEPHHSSSIFDKQQKAVHGTHTHTQRQK